MRHIIFLYFVISFNVFLFGQGAYSIDKQGYITNFYKKTEFYNFCQVDFDFNKATNCIQATTLVIFDINSEGTGSFHLFVEKKTSFKIVKCYKSETSFHFDLENTYGTKFKAALFLKNNSIDKFYFQSLIDNTGYLLY